MASGIGVDDQPFAKSTLQLFRDRLVLHRNEQTVFQRSVDATKGSGLLKSRKLKVALDTTPVFGKGAAKDTLRLRSGQALQPADGRDSVGGSEGDWRLRHGDGATRPESKAHGYELVVKVPRGRKPGYYAKGDFKVDLEHDRVTCPAGQTTRK